MINYHKYTLTLGQAYFELQKFEDAKKEFRIAARDKNKKVKTTANNWIKYTENEEIRVKNLALRRDLYSISIIASDIPLFQSRSHFQNLFYIILF